MMKRALVLLCLLLLLLPAAHAEEENTFTLTFLGDCSIGDSIQYRDYDVSYHTLLKEKGYDFPFANVKDILAADDLTIANLEVVFTTKRKPRADKSMNLIGDPDFVNVLTQGSVEVVNTANNHAWDFGSAGYHEMLGYLDAAEIPHFGTLYPTSEDGSDIYPIVEARGVKVGFMGFSYPQEYDRKRITNRIETLRE